MNRRELFQTVAAVAMAAVSPAPMSPYAYGRLIGCRWIVTIKKRLAPGKHTYTFADPKFLGSPYPLEEVIMQQIPIQ